MSAIPTEKPVDRLSTSVVVPPKKRRKPSSVDHMSSSPLVNSETENMQQPTLERPIASQSTSPFVPALMALPPAILSSYSYPQLTTAAVPYFHPLFAGGPYYVPVGASPPPSLMSQSHSKISSASSSSMPRILPKTSAVVPHFVESHGQSHFTSPPLHPSNPEYGYRSFNIPIAPSPIGRGDEEKKTTADEREHARKMSHSAIERRRRERINDKIAQLRQLIPSCSNQDHLHKMTVLQSAIDYIGYLKVVISRLDDDDQVRPAANKEDQQPGHGLDTATAPVTPEDDRDQEEVLVVATHDRKGMKPIDVIRAGIAASSSTVSPVPSPSCIQSQEWTSSTSSSLPPPLLTETSKPSCLPGRTCSPRRISSSSSSPVWSGDDECTSTILPTPSLTPQSGSHQKHMRVENLLC